MVGRIGRVLLLGLVAIAMLLVPNTPVFGLNGTWTTKASMPTARASLAVGVVNGILYAVAGGPTGNTLEAYDPMANAWTEKTPMPAVRGGPNAEVVNGILYVIGGGDGPPGWFNTVYAYNPSSDSWTSKASMASATSAAVTGVINGKIYVAGGYAGGEVTALQVYDPVANTWATKASLPTPVHSGAGGVVNGILYVVGGCFDGCNSSSNVLNTVEAYDPSTDAWSIKAPMPTARYNLAAGVVNGILYAVGGNKASGTILGTNEAYDPTTNTWATEPSMSTARTAPGAGVANGALYVVGGYNSGFLNTNEAFTPVISFAAFSAKVDIDPAFSAFAASSTFTLGSGGSPFNPQTDAVTFQLTSQSSSFTTTIPKNSFQKYTTRYGTAYIFFGVVDGVFLLADIAPPIKGFTTQWHFKIAGSPAPGAGALTLPPAGTNPVTVNLTIGNNTGGATVTAYYVTTYR